MYFFIYFFILFNFFQSSFVKADENLKKNEESDDNNGKTSTGAIKFQHQFGVILGYSLGSVFSNELDIEDQLYKRHFFSGGLFYNFSHVDFARIQFEVLYYQKGAQSDIYESKMHVLSIPILARFQTEIGFLAKVGLGVSIIIDPSIVIDKKIPLFDTEKNLKKLAFDTIGAIGWRFKLAKEFYTFLEFRFAYTVNNLNYLFSEKKTIHPFNIFFYVGFEFL